MTLKWSSTSRHGMVYELQEEKVGRPHNGFVQEVATATAFCFWMLSITLNHMVTSLSVAVIASFVAHVTNNQMLLDSAKI